jgi:hypothetical protein
MPLTYSCDTCGASTEVPDNWQIISVSVLHYDTSLPGSGRVVDATYPDLWFDTKQCRDVWLERAGLPKGPP